MEYEYQERLRRHATLPESKSVFSLGGIVFHHVVT